MRRIFLMFIGIFIFCFNTFTYAEEKFPSTNSPSIIVIDSKTGQVLYGKNINQKLFPASITKVVTALITLEKCKLNEKVIASKHAIYSVEPGSSTAGFQPGEELTVEQLLYGLMLNSANESANVLAEHIGGSIPAFVDMMNARAKQLGANNTHFVTPNGLHNDNHYTTVYDMSLIARQAMTIPKFRQIVSTVRYQMPPTNKYKKNDKVLINSDKLINPSSKYYYKFANGIKTGYTLRAGHSLVAGASKDGIDLIAVFMNSKIKDGYLQTYTDSVNLFNYIFDNYKKLEPVKNGTVVKQIPIKNAKKNVQLKVTAQNSISFLVPKNAKSCYTVNEIVNKDLAAPIQKGSIVGHIEYMIDGKSVGKTNLIAMNQIEKDKPVSLFGIVFKFIIITILIIIGVALLLVLAIMIWAKAQHRKVKLIRKRRHSLKIQKILED